VTPGWYTDPHDPRQLRWWSGEGWTEHVSPGAGQQPAAEAAPAQATDAPLPSRRALRDPATEASEAAEAALAAQAAQQQAAAAEQQAQQQAAAQSQADQQAQAAAAQQAAQQAAWGAQQAAAQPVQPVQPEAVQPQAVQPPAAQPDAAQPQPVQPEAVQPQYGAPVAAQQPSAPVPTLPVAPTSFLEQQGYAPLDGSAPAAQEGWTEPTAGQSAPEQPQPYQPVDAQPAGTQPNAWNQPVQPLEPVQPVQPVQPAQPNAWNQPVQPESAQPSAWNQPVQPTQPEPQVWGAPAADGIDNLFGGVPSGQVPTQSPQANQWGLTPSDADSGSQRQANEVAGSSTLWAWLIAISPILAAGAVAYVMLTLKPAFTDWPFEAAVAAPYLLVLLFAIADRAALLHLGHSQPRSPAWALLSAPVYLIARAGETRREDGSGTALTIVWFISVLVAVGGIVGYGFLTHHALIAGLPT
jgi:hypothetical protein